MAWSGGPWAQAAYGVAPGKSCSSKAFHTVASRCYFMWRGVHDKQDLWQTQMPSGLSRAHCDHICDMKPQELDHDLKDNVTISQILFGITSYSSYNI